jgi:hypothetical protein
MATSCISGVANAKEKSMPQVIDAPEAVQAERWHAYEEKTASLSSIDEPRPARRGFLATVWSAVTSWTTRHACSELHDAHIQQQFELPIDRIAREHPFLYVMSLAR